MARTNDFILGYFYYIWFANMDHLNQQDHPICIHRLKLLFIQLWGTDCKDISWSLGWKHYRNPTETPQSSWVLMEATLKAECRKWRKKIKRRGNFILQNPNTPKKEFSLESTREIEDLLCHAANLRGWDMRNGSTKGNKVPFPYLLTNLQTKLWRNG